MENTTSKKKKEHPITSITVKGFKSIRDETEIELKPLTILAGANSSGKSSVIQPLLLLKQTLECPYDPGPLYLEKENVRFTSANQVLWRGKSTKSINSFSIGLKSEFIQLEQSFLRSGLKSDDFSINSIKFKLTNEGRIYEWKPNMRTEELIDNIPHFILRSFNKDIIKDLQWNFERIKYILLLDIRHNEFRIPLLGAFQSPLEEFNPYISQLIHLPGLRGIPERKYPKTAIGKNFPGLFYNYAPSILVKWKQSNDDRLNQLCNWLFKLGLTWKIIPYSRDATFIELLVGRLHTSAKAGAHDLVSIADVGFGVSQVMPVLIAMLVAEPGQLVFIEQPELHLHPNAQVKLAELIAETAKRKVILIIETHSSLLLKTIQALIAEKKLPKDLVKLHWFTRQEDGSSKVYSGNLDKKGAYGDWPEDFSIVDLEAEGRYLDAATG